MAAAVLTCGAALFLATSLQQHGLLTTTAGKGGFITALYVVIVPFLGLFLRKKVRPLVWLAVVLAILGLYLLTIKDGLRIQKGDLIMLGGVRMGDPFYWLNTFQRACRSFIARHLSPASSDRSLRFCLRR